MVERKRAKNVRKLRSRNYPIVLEVYVPTRYYWTEGEEYPEFDGVEFGPFDNLLRQEKKHIDLILASLGVRMEAKRITDFMRKKYPEFWKQIMGEIEAEDLGVPWSFLDAFKSEDEENAD